MGDGTDAAAATEPKRYRGLLEYDAVHGPHWLLHEVSVNSARELRRYAGLPHQ